jgi:hypothetical protein
LIQRNAAVLKPEEFVGFTLLWWIRLAEVHDPRILRFLLLILSSAETWTDGSVDEMAKALDAVLRERFVLKPKSSLCHHAPDDLQVVPGQSRGNHGTKRRLAEVTLREARLQKDIEALAGREQRHKAYVEAMAVREKRLKDCVCNIARKATESARVLKIAAVVLRATEIVDLTTQDESPMNVTPELLGTIGNWLAGITQELHQHGK